MSDPAAAIAWVIDAHERGFQANPSDHGNYYQGRLLGTNWGISAPVAVQYGWDPNTSLRSMPRSFAESIWLREFWPGLEGITDPNVAAKILDMRASGKARADRYVQLGLRSLGWVLDVDGIIGPQTTEALNGETDREALQAMLCQQQAAIYQASAGGTNAGFLGAWLTRAADWPGWSTVVTAGVSLWAVATAGVLIYLVVKS